MSTKRIGALRRRIVAALAMGTLIATVAVGGGAAFALFSASAEASGTARAGTIAITSANFPTLSSTYINSRLTSTGSFTITNTGTIEGVATASITAPGTFAPHLKTQVWARGTQPDCRTPQTPITTGSWAATTVTTAQALPAGASAIFCVRTTITDRKAVATAAGDQSQSATLTASVTNATWVAQAQASVALQQTDDIYPLDAAVVIAKPNSRWFTMSTGTVCGDVLANGQTSGSAIISAACDKTASQRWQMVPVDEADRSLVTLAPKHVPGMRLGVSGTGQQQLQATAAGAAQQWYLQKVTATSWQLVSALDGRCLTVRNTASTASTAVADCNTPNTKLKLTREPLKFENAGLLGTGYRLDLGTIPEGYPIVVEHRELITQNFTRVGTITGQKTPTINMVLNLGGTNEFRIVFTDPARTVLYQGTVTKPPVVGPVSAGDGFG